MNAVAPALFDALCQQLHAQPDRRGRVHIDCPACGKETKRGQTHCSFSEKGVFCFVCGFGGSLGKLAEALDVTSLSNAPVRPERPVAPPKPKVWQEQPERILASYGEPLDRLQAWQQYKPLSLDSIGRWRLGIGKLPFEDKYGRPIWGKYRRLILPVFDDGRLVALHGRAIHPEDTTAKWICATGSRKDVLFNADLLTRGCTVIVCENQVDAILAMQETPGIVAVAGGGVAWRDEWTAIIAAAQPKLVLVWLDHDLSGNGSAYHHRELVATWRAEIEARRAKNPDLARLPFPKPPEPVGPRIATALSAARVRATLYRWPQGTPAKMDLGAALMQGDQS